MNAVGPTPGPPPAVGAFRETNGLAIASLILGIFAVVPVSIVLGIVALRKIKRRDENGRGLAIAGISISCTWVVVAVAGIALLASNLVHRDGSGRIVEGGYLTKEDLGPGDCLISPKKSHVLLHAVPCEEAHDAEVVGRFRLDGDGYPGADAIRRRASAGCVNRLQSWAGAEAALTVRLTYFAPARVDWALDDHDVTCFARFDPRRRGSLAET